MKLKILFALGTRPEAIKLAPLIIKAKAEDHFKVKVCSTGQHSEMLKQVLEFFEIQLDYDFKLMKNNQSLSVLTSDIIQKCHELFNSEYFDGVIVQGDTTTVMSVALSSFYFKIPVFHVESGLRTENKYSPFPEEMNRLLTTQLASCYFCPTKSNANNLSNEGIKKNVFVVGNTVVDALNIGLKKINQSSEIICRELLSKIDVNKKLILMTAHRRENFGKPLKTIFNTINTIANERNDVQFLYPVHLNPNVKSLAHEYLTSKNILLTRPLGYKELIYFMEKAYFIITDSGGIQEEAPSLKKPVIVLREHTERIEGVECGNAVLVGSDLEKINFQVKKILNDSKYYNSFSAISNPYGDGKSSQRILNHIKTFLIED